MKVARNVFFGLVVAGAMVFVSGVSFAQIAAAATKDVSAAKKAKYEARIKLLQDSATALQATNPVLAVKLTDIVNGQSKGKAEGSKEKVVKGSPEWKAKRDARVQLYKDAATALQATRPDLAKGLMDMTIPKQKTAMQKAAGEKTEPKSEQGESK